ncbi:MAG: PEP-CTERM sorting domain-containing protein [Kiloniellaceae bacterium]
MIRKALYFCALALGLGIFHPLPAQAIPVTTTVTGSVDFADGSNPFGLATAEAVTAVAVYDDGGIPAAGAFNLPIDGDPTFSLTITLGSFVFTEIADTSFGSGFPRLVFDNGNLVGIDFEIDGFPLGGFADLILGAFGPQDSLWFLDEFVSGAPNNVLLEGSWDFANAVTEPNAITEVPEPDTWPLLAGGLVGLLALSRRRPKAIPSV